MKKICLAIAFALGLSSFAGSTMARPVKVEAREFERTPALPKQMHKMPCVLPPTRPDEDNK